LHSEEHQFQYEGVLGTSMDLVVWTPRPHDADIVCRTILKEIDRLDSILNTRITQSEISLFENATGNRSHSRDLGTVLNAYDYWASRTGGVLSVRPGGANTARNVDALGKAHIIDSAVMAARNAGLSIDGLLLNIGGDIATWGTPCDISLTN